MGRERSLHAEKNRLAFRNVVLLRTFLDVVEIIQAEANDLAGPRHRQAKFQSSKRMARRRRRFPRQIAERFEIAVSLAQRRAEIGRHIGVHRLQIDHGIALDHAEPQAVTRFKTDKFHEFPALAMTREARLSAGGRITKDGSSLDVKLWAQAHRPT